MQLLLTTGRKSAMKKHWLMSAAILALVSAGAFAEDITAPAPAMEGKHHEVTLEQARERAHKHADKLDKMTPEEYAAQKEKRREHREKWKHMTPEERTAAKKAHHDKWLAKHHTTGGADTSSTPATPPADGK
jgi:DNA polymerase III alpha subunit